jgi:Ca-activated chloride channel family protein
MRTFGRVALYPLLAVFLVFGASARTPVAATEGGLQVLDKDKIPAGFCPLNHTEVSAEITGFIARVTVTQEFGNPFHEPIEAVYTFPLSQRGAVDSMTMTIGERVIKGIVKKREEARRIYEQARNAGKAASLLDQERPNIFTQSVANILPGDRILITISYVECLEYEDGRYEFSFPMVVGPRYIPGQPADGPRPLSEGGARPVATDQAPDADRITPPVTPEGMRAGHDIALSVRIDAGMPIQDLRSELHEVEVERPSDTQAVVRLKNQREIPNRDFVLRYAVAGRSIEDAVLTHVGAQGGFFTLILQPPERVTPEQVTPKEMVFVIDCSGSMRGFPIEKAKKAMRLCIEQMNPQDTFNLVSFSGGTGYCFNGPVPNTEENRRLALEYLARLEGRGGTEMMPAIRAALERQNDHDRLRIVCFMTDGFIGNDMEILDAVRKNAQTARVFSFGVGNGVNRFLIEGMARTGRGASEVVTLESDADAAAKHFHERIRSPLLTDLTLDFGGLPIEDVYPDPEAVPDLFAAQPLVVTGRYSGAATGAITVRGKTAAGAFERKVDVVLPKEAQQHDVLASLWARARIDWLMEQDWLGIQKGRPDLKIKDAITQLGLDFNLVTPFTSFVAVEEKVITQGGVPKTVQVPVEMTDGVSYEGVFGAPSQAMAGQVQALGYLGSPNISKAMAFAAPLADGVPQSRMPAPAVAGVRPETMAESVVPPRPNANRVSEAIRKPDAPNEKVRAKLDAALWGLAAKLVNGQYAKGPVKVTDGWVEVFIRLSEDSPERLEALKQRGVVILAHTASGKRIHARVKVTELEQVAELDFVQRIEPPRF